MTRVEVEAAVKWRSIDEGGRHILPAGETYTTIARFEQQAADDWPREVWSLVVRFIDKPSYDTEGRVMVRFLTNGPSDYLEKGNHFELREGERVVAIGRVTGS
jgi:hypothetical protein